MSTENQDRTSAEENSEVEETGEQSSELTSNYQTKLEAHYRDRYKCLCCGKQFDDGADLLDLDHIVPRGSGGSRLHSNCASLCRECHEAKHNEDVIAPTIRFTSSGDMNDEEFRWYRHFWDEILPALSEAAVGQRITPLFNLRDNALWEGRYIPLGEIRYCDEYLRDRDEINYTPMEE